MVKFTKHLQGIMGIVQNIYKESWVMLRSVNHVQMADDSSSFRYYDIAQNLYHFLLNCIYIIQLYNNDIPS